MPQFQLQGADNDSRASDREPLALRVVAEHNADLVEIMRQADRNLQRRHNRKEPKQ